jgi:hypothetical protein
MPYSPTDAVEATARQPFRIRPSHRNGESTVAVPVADRLYEFTPQRPTTSQVRSSDLDDIAFEKQETGCIAVKVINDYAGEVLKVSSIT